MPRLKQDVVRTRIARARHAVGRGIHYRMGHGGTDPNLALPTRTGFCDCSGFVSWVLFMDRDQHDKNKAWSHTLPWLETTAIYRDATGLQRCFVKLESIEPGCLLVYPDRKVLGVHREGHIALVTRVEGTTVYGIDCSSRKGGKTGEAIREWDLTWMAKKAIPVALKQDIA